MKINTDEMRAIATDINTLATDYQKKITDLYNKFINLPDTKEWTGGRANDYVKLVLLDKNELMGVGDGIKSFSRIITESANTVDSTVTKIKKGEE